MSVSRDGESEISGRVSAVHRVEGLAGLGRGLRDLPLDVFHVLQGGHRGVAVLVDGALEI